MVGDDVLINKRESIKRCLKRINEEFNGDEENLRDLKTQDSIVLNLQRACETSIDLAMHLVRKKSLGVPQNSREAFEMLEKAKIIRAALSTKMKKMVGFRNIAIHNYQTLDLEIIESIVRNNLQDFADFVKAVKKS